ncbi:alpha-ribazole phosphatase [Paraflavisolibacter sp. H34]|uniref:alpha-ribazole phosphatase n=1 Tax=Huijunlia imazamoxiresistens TaxID=3127457 RepID=UPI003017C2DB
MEIYLIRHTTPDIAPGMVYGRSDVPLAATFADELLCVRQRLPHPVDAVYSSPSGRCRRLAHALREDYNVDERLYEVDFGNWEGKTWAEICPEELNPWMEDFVHQCPPGGESLLQMHGRVLSFWEELQQQRHQRVAVVTHGGVIRLLLAARDNIPLSGMFDIEAPYGGVFLW